MNGNAISEIIEVKSENLSIKLKYEDGFIGIVSLNHIFNPPKGLALEVLEKSIFDKCFVQSGALAWPNGLELCPDAIRIWIDKQSKNESLYEPENLYKCTHCNVTFKGYSPPCYFCGKDGFTKYEINEINIYACYACNKEWFDIMLSCTPPTAKDEPEIEIKQLRLKALNILIENRLTKYSHKCEITDQDKSSYS